MDTVKYKSAVLTANLSVGLEPVLDVEGGAAENGLASPAAVVATGDDELVAALGTRRTGHRVVDRFGYQEARHALAGRARREAHRTVTLQS